nr:TIGR04086 family membrane protein [Lentibacillus sp. JNUCC-1]
MTALMYGWIIVLGSILIASLLLGFLLKFTSMNETALFWVTLAAGLISLFIGGLFAGLKGKEKGWLIGGLTGIGFTLFVFLVQYLGYQEGLNLHQVLYHLGYIAAAVIGGVVGVNMTTASDSQ